MKDQLTEVSRKWKVYKRIQRRESLSLWYSFLRKVFPKFSRKLYQRKLLKQILKSNEYILKHTR